MLEIFCDADDNMFDNVLKRRRTDHVLHTFLRERHIFTRERTKRSDQT